MSEPTGAVVRKLDSAWRVAMPDALLRIYPTTIVLTPGFDNCIRGYGIKHYEEFERVLGGLDPNDPDEADYIRFFRALATTVTLDSSNRFRISDPLMGWLGVDDEKRELLVFDAGDYFEVWETGRWNQFMSERAVELKDLARRIFGKKQGRQEEEREHGAGARAGNGH